MVPKYSAKYVPSSSVTEANLEGIGQVEVGSQFMYIPVKLVWQLQTTISLHTNLQIEVSCCREYFSSKYGKSDKMPPFDPDSLQEACIVASANKLSHVIFNAMSYEDRSEKRQEHNKEKVVTIIYMLMYSRSQKASWFQKVMSNMVVGKDMSEGGSSVLHKSGIAVSKSTQR